MCGYVEFYSETNINKTRKPHRCIWCGEVIDRGSKAVVFSGKGDDGLFRDYHHPECDQAIKDSDWPDPHEICWEPGEFERGKTLQALGGE